MVSLPIRKTHSAKARKSTSRKKGKAKKHQLDIHRLEETNVDILVPKSNEEKDKQRKEQLLQELTSQSESTWTNKKKRRLEKYIEKKVKKEDRLLLFEKLAQSQASISTNVLRSSSTLGTNRLFTVGEDALFRAGQKRKRNEDFFDGYHSDIPSDIDINDESTTECAIGHSSSSTQNVLIQDTVKKCSNYIGLTAQRKSAGGWAKRGRLEIDDETSTSFDSSDSGCDEEITRQNLPPVNDEGQDNKERDNDLDSAVEKPPAPPSIPTRKSSGFKDWALVQLRKARGNNFIPIDLTVEAESLLPPNKGRETDRRVYGPLGGSLEVPSTSFAQRIMASGGKGSSYIKIVEVKRPPEVESSRVLLPIITEEQVIMETILLNPVVIICGETGSGKTTQVPQFLYEAGFGTPGSENPGMIGITQPRRVAAIAMSQRVAHELSLNSAHVSYQIRYDATVSQNTSIKFMTDGVLLRELAVDFLLAKYSVIIIDEAHERNINTDILIGVLSRVIKLREELWKKGGNDTKPLRLIIMSATLRISDFLGNKNLFASPPPVIDVAARQHPVTIHFSRCTHSDYITQAIRKTINIHRRLPPGGILVFLTGQSDILGVCKELEAKFGQNSIKERRERDRGFTDSIDDRAPSLRSVAVSQAPMEVEDFELHDEHDGIADSGDEGRDESQEDANSSHDFDINLDAPMYIVPLYSLLPSEKQLRVFSPPPPDCRLVVISTNIAETSLTIPGIRYVVDCGRVKERRYDAASGVQSFHISWVSKASSAQRAGRAGRTGPGHCYRLYSSAFYEHHFDSFSTPEIQRMPIDGVVLQMKSMGIDVIVNFPFPTPPDRQALYKAEKILTYLGALGPSDSKKETGQITELGRAMSLFPLSPRFSRMLVSSQQHGCLPYVVCIVSALAVGDPFTALEILEGEVREAEESSAGLRSDTSIGKDPQRRLRKAFYHSQQTHAALGNYTSDFFKYLSVIGAYEYAGGTLEFCTENFVQPKMMQEIHNLRSQISNIIVATFPGTDADLRARLTPPNDRQLNSLRQILTAAFLDQVAVRKDIVEKKRSGTRFSTSRGIPYRALGVSEDVYLHASSILIGSPPPAYLVFNEIIRTSRVYLRGLTVINPAWLSTFGKDTLCSFSKAVKNNLGVFVTVPMFGPDRWELPAINVDNAGTISQT